MEDRILLSAEECITLIEKESGTVIALRTFHAYAHRGQAPKSVDKKGRTPLWDKAEMVNWIHNRPGRGNRSRAWKTENKQEPGYNDAPPTPAGAVRSINQHQKC